MFKFVTKARTDLKRGRKKRRKRKYANEFCFLTIKRRKYVNELAF